MSALIRYSHGSNKYDNLPAQCEAENFDIFKRDFLSIRAKRKGAEYISAPFSAGEHNDPQKFPGTACWRIQRLVGLRGFLPFDIDGFDTPSTAESLLNWLKRLKGFAYTTASHTESAPRLRLVIASSRSTTRPEGITACLALQTIIEKEFGNGRIIFDESVYKAEQPLYAALQDAKVFQFDGEPIDIDQLVKCEAAFEDKGALSTKAHALGSERASNDLVWSHLDIFGYVKQHLGGGKYSITCPFENEHSSTTGDSSTVYFLPNSIDYPFGAFHCLHAHCNGRTQEEFIDAVGIDSKGLRLKITMDGIQAANDTDETHINRLAKLTHMEYDRVRNDAAKALHIRPGTLDKQVQTARKERIETGPTLFPKVEPWPDKIDPASLLTEIETTVRRFIVCEPETVLAAALWAAMTWFIDVIKVAPLAVITAPEMRCGKSQLLFLLGRIVRSPIPASNITPAALFRSIELWRPTLLIDEADAFMRDNEELRGLINCGHTRDSAFVIRTVGDDHTPTSFNVWGAKALAGIGRLAGTIMDRSITLELRRKLPEESSERFRYAEDGLFDAISSKLARFSEDYSEIIRNARPNLPDTLHSRAQDNWEPLFAIADLAGGDFPARARAAAIAISGEDASPQSVGVELLADIKTIIEKTVFDRISTAELTAELCADDEKPWATYNRGQPIKPHQVSKRLRAFGVTSNTIRLGVNTAKGFRLEQFNEVFERYLP